MHEKYLSKGLLSLVLSSHGHVHSLMSNIKTYDGWEHSFGWMKQTE